jgi:hypothetical protein
LPKDAAARSSSGTDICSIDFPLEVIDPVVVGSFAHPASAREAARARVAMLEERRNLFRAMIQFTGTEENVFGVFLDTAILL